MRKSSLSVLAVAVLSAGCGPGEAPLSRVASPPPAPPAAGSAPSSPAQQNPAHDGTADMVVARALREVSRLRELPAKGPVRGKLVSRAEMVAHVRRDMLSEVPPDAMTGQAEMLFALGAVPPDFDYEQSLMDLMTAQLAGFYEPKDKTMYLSADLAPAERKMTLDHELVHALQDQYFGLGKRLDYRADASDEQSAVHALAEGGATSAMLDAMLEPRHMHATDLSDDAVGVEARGSIELSPAAAKVPDILKRSIVSAYVDGISLVHWARRRGGWAAVDALWAHPPTTTEQLLHPAKLLAHEVGDSIEIPVAPSKGPARVLYHDIEGEQSVRLVLEGWMPRSKAIQAASGWDGDRVAVFRDGQRFAFAWHLRYDTTADAERGLEAFARGMLATARADQSGHSDLVFIGPEEARTAVKGGSACRARRLAGPFALVRQGQDVAIVAGPYLRNQKGPRADGTCTAALKWARAVVVQQSARAAGHN